MNPNFDLAWRKRAMAGEPRAIEALAETALPPLYAFCLYRVGRNRHLCEEVVQETLVEAIRKLAQYDPGRCGNNILSWLVGLARNVIHRTLSRQRSAVSLEAMWERMDKELLDVYRRLEAAPLGEDVLERQETCEMVNMTMSQLPPHYREALEAKYVEGRSVRDIAAASQISEKAAESLLTRSREAFRVTFLALARNLNLEIETIA